MYNSGEEELDRSKLRYVLYARKSTEDKERQLKSEEDQIAECLAHANRMGITIKPEDIIKEEGKSAKTSGKRTAFNNILKEIKLGNIDGILAWHPDRLARNMKEGGEIIELIDTGQLIDVQFVTHYFEKTASGKMLLGMAFVLSKHYSDNLAQNVSRGMRQKLADGKSSGTPRHGYIRLKDGAYVPDGKNFELICKAWEMKKNRVSLELIAEYLKQHGYYRTTKPNLEGKTKKILLTKQRLSKLFRNPFYYGILVQKDTSIDLRDAYDFKPAVSEEDFYLIQSYSRAKKQPFTNKNKTFLPLRGMVICSFCSNAMTPGASPNSQGVKYLTYRCTRKNCDRTKKSIRGQVIFNAVAKIVAGGMNMGKQEYQRYIKRLDSLSEYNLQDIRNQLYSITNQENRLNAEMKNISLGIANLAASGANNTDKIIEQNNKRFDEIEDDLIDLGKTKTRLKSQIIDPSLLKLSYEDFLNLSKSASAKLKMGNTLEKDVLCRIIFLNLYVDNQKVANYSCREPFATLLLNRKVSNGRGERTIFEPLLNAIINHWKAKTYQTELANAQQMVKQLGKSYNVEYEYR